MKSSKTLSVAVIVLSLFFAGVDATHAATIFLSGVVTDSSGSGLSGVLIEMTGTPSINTTSGGDGSFVLEGLPSDSDFSVKMSQGGFVPTYTHNYNSSTNITGGSDFTLHTPSQVSSWGVISGKGVIRGRVDDKNNQSVYIGGAVVTCSSALHPGTSCPYTVTYYNGTSYGGASTYANGRYLVLNVDDGDTVAVTAAKAEWDFAPRTFITHADAVSSGRIHGSLNDGIYFAGVVTDSSGSGLNGVLIEMTGTPSINTTSGGDGSFVLEGLPSGSDFSVKMSQGGFVPTYTHNYNSSTNITDESSFVLYTPSQVSSWGVISGKGVIRGRVDDKNNQSVYIGGAVVTCSSALHPGTLCPYTVTYYNGTSLGGASTYANGVYFVLNVDDGDTVAVTASKTAWDFTPRTFITHADAVSAGRIHGRPTGSISGAISYSGSQTGTIYVGLFSSPTITLESYPLYITQISSPGAYTFLEVEDGTYYVGAILDAYDDSNILITDPYGMYGINFVSDFTADPVTVSGGADVTGRNFTLMDGTSEHPNPFYCAGTIQLSSATYSVAENAGTVTITATRTGGSCGAVGISYVTSDGAAKAGSDYVWTSGTLSWADEETAVQTFTVPITNDTLDEPNETFTVTLSSPTGGATLGSPSSATVTITDDDPPPTVQFASTTSSGLETMTPAAITVTLSAASGKAVTVNFATANGTATAGSDYTSMNGTLTFDPGATSQTINVPITNDSTVETNETFTVTLSTPTNATLGAITTHTYTINDNDVAPAGSIAFSSVTYGVNENGGTVTVTATRTGGGGGAVGASYATSDGTATAGSDYSSASGTLSWANGDMANKTLTVNITNDTLYEQNETFTVTLSSPTGGAALGSPNSATVTITDDDISSPIVTATTPTTDTTPTWTWTSGGGGSGTFRYRLDNPDLSTGATTTILASFTPSTALSNGDHTLYVQEKNAAGLWSASGSKTVLIDAPLYNLTVTRSGTGSGKVISSPLGIDCGADCEEGFAIGTKATKVSLTAIPYAGSTFKGWSGACIGTKTKCSLIMDASKVAVAEFALPDLTGTFSDTLVSFKKTSYQISTALTVTPGEANAANVTIKVYLSDDGILDVGDTLLTPTPISLKSLKFDKVKPKKLKITSLVNPSGKNLIAVLDPDNTVLETDDNNNIVVGLIP